MVRAGWDAGRDGGGEARVGEHMVVHEVGPLPGWTDAKKKQKPKGRRWMGGGSEGWAEEVRVGGVCRDKIKIWFQPKREENFFLGGSRVKAGSRCDACSKS